MCKQNKINVFDDINLVAVSTLLLAAVDSTRMQPRIAPSEFFRRYALEQLLEEKERKKKEQGKNDDNTYY